MQSIYRYRLDCYEHWRAGIEPTGAFQLAAEHPIPENNHNIAVILYIEQYNVPTDDTGLISEAV